MYATKQILRHDIAVELPQCMYPLKSVYKGGRVDGASPLHAFRTTSDICEQVKQFLKANSPAADMGELLARQDKILQQLADLKKQMLNISSELKLTSQPIQSSSGTKSKTKFAPVKTEDLPNLVIHAGPNYPPHSLALVQKLWQNDINLAVSIHLHSTVPSLPKEAQQLSDSLQKFKPKTNLPTLSVRLIWNNVGPDLELLVSIVPILGEVNVLRYLARCCQNILTYESTEDRHEIDSILDIAYLLPRTKSKADKSAYLAQLNNSLGSSKWLISRQEISVADLAVYSAVRQIGSNQLNSALSKWFANVQAALK